MPELKLKVFFFFFFKQVTNFVPPLLDAVLIDCRNVPAAREPEVLSTMAIVNKLGGHITAEIPQIFDAVFECTLNMINKVCNLHFSYIMASSTVNPYYF